MEGTLGLRYAATMTEILPTARIARAAGAAEAFLARPAALLSWSSTWRASGWRKLGASMASTSHGSTSAMQPYNVLEASPGCMPGITRPIFASTGAGHPSPGGSRFCRVGRLHQSSPAGSSLGGIHFCGYREDAFHKGSSDSSRSSIGNSSSSSSSSNRSSSRRRGTNLRASISQSEPQSRPPGQKTSPREGSSASFEQLGLDADNLGEDGRTVCPGCGIEMQDRDPRAPGFFRRPASLDEDDDDDESDENGGDDLADLEARLGGAGIDDLEQLQEEDDDGSGLEEEGSGAGRGGSKGVEKKTKKKGGGKEGQQREGWVTITGLGKELGLEGLLKGEEGGEGEGEGEGGEEGERGEGKVARVEKQIDLERAGFAPVGDEYGGWSKAEEERKKAKATWNKLWEEDSEGGQERAAAGGEAAAAAAAGPAEKVVVCARCHALRHYGQVKDESVENLLPDFDFERVVGARLRRAYGRRAVVVMLIDTADFDGSFPRTAAQVLAQAEADLSARWQEGDAANVPRLLVVANKVDLLPKQISPARFEQWVRRRAKAGGAPRVTGVHAVSAHTGTGIAALYDVLKDLAGPRGDVWVVGAQNAGKSSLINALSRVRLSGRRAQLTEAPLPGTTIGVVAQRDILAGRARLLDTPGLLHPHQLTLRLTREEQKLVLPRKLLKPRTFRIKVGSTIHIGGLARLDVVEAPSESIYLTVWVSAHIPCHMGKTVNADSVFEQHVGDKLFPPASQERVAELGQWLPRTATLEGTRWDQASADVAIAGLGWVGVSLKGTATLRVWTYEGVAVTTREALAFDHAALLEKPGFTSMKVPASKKGKASKRSEDVSASMDLVE